MAERSQTETGYDATGQITSTGSANAYVVTIAQSLNGYYQGMPQIRFKANFTCSGSSTVNIATPNAPSGLGAVTLKKSGGASNLASGDIVSGGVYTIAHDGTFFQVLELATSTSGATALNVQNYGAVGNGTSNDAVAIQAALDAASAGSVKRVYFPHTAGGYAVSASLLVDDGITLFGDNVWGAELSRIKPTASFTDPLIQTRNFGSSRKLRVGILGLFLDGSSTTLTAIKLNIQESLIQNCTIKNCFTYGIHFGGIGSGSTQQALNNHIIDNYLSGSIGTTEFFDGIFVDYFSADNILERNYIEACKDAGIRSRGYNNKITNNHIYSIAGTGGGEGCGIYIETSADHDISQNYIELCAAEGVLIQGGGSDVSTLAAVVSGNVFRNIDTGDTSNGVVELSGADVSSFSILGNVVRRDAAAAYATPYFVYFNGITPTFGTVAGNSWQSGLITTAESNVSLPVQPELTVAPTQNASGLSAVEFTSLPATLNRIVVNFLDVSLSGTNDFLIQVGDSGGFETTGYLSAGGINTGAGVATVTSTAGHIIHGQLATRILSGSMILSRMDTNWISTHSFGDHASGDTYHGGGRSPNLTPPLDRVRVVPSGANTFDGGFINIHYE